MKTLFSAVVACAALTSAVAPPPATEGSPAAGYAVFQLGKPFGNSTHYFDKAAGRIVKHYADWSNGTHFKDQQTGEKIQHFNCDVHQGQATEHFNKTVRDLHENYRKGAVRSRSTSLIDRRKVSVPINKVPLYVHVLYKKNEEGVVTQAMATNQIAALNKMYNPYGVSFQLQNISWTANDAWAVAAGTDMDDLKKALRVGSYSALNLYFHTDLSGGVLGTCTLPAPVEPGTPRALYYSDGCNINAHTMPGGSLAGYNQGKTAVHETGHWLGLLHTFEGYSCSGPGDSVADTPVESVSTNGCPTNPWKNSCVGESKGDPIHNYMDYSTDACYSKFTKGQVARISTMWSTYRQGK